LISGGGAALGASPSNRAIDINTEDVEVLLFFKDDAASTSPFTVQETLGSYSYHYWVRGEHLQLLSIQSYNVGTVNRLPDYQNEYAQGLNGTLTPAQIGVVIKMNNATGTMNCHHHLDLKLCKQ
jgi:hypothetical protein